LKSGGRILGIDDAPFSFEDEFVPVVGTVVRPPCYLEGVMMSQCRVDGADATVVIIAMLERSRYREQVKAVMLDGIAVCGFNIVDINQLTDALGVPVITVTRDQPDLAAMEAALRKHQDDGEFKIRLLRRTPPARLDLPDASSWVSFAGCDRMEAEEIVRMAVVRGGVPEPVRMAHLIASALVRGESRGL
jgi:endonuclease V-like protein UPF0215 family